MIGIIVIIIIIIIIIIIRRRADPLRFPPRSVPSDKRDLVPQTKET